MPACAQVERQPAGGAPYSCRCSPALSARPPCGASARIVATAAGVVGQLVGQVVQAHEQPRIQPGHGQPPGGPGVQQRVAGRGGVAGRHPRLARRMPHGQSDGPGPRGHVQPDLRPPGCDARQRFAPVEVVTAHGVGLRAQVQPPGPLGQPPAAFELEALQPGAHAFEAVLGHRFALLRGHALPAGPQRDEAREAGAVDAGLGQVRPRAPGQRGAEVAAALHAQRRITALVGGGGHVHAVGKQLVVGRGPLGVPQRQAQGPGCRDRPGGRQRQAGGREAALQRRAEARFGRQFRGIGRVGGRDVAGRPHPHALAARTGLQPPAAEIGLLQHEQRLRARARVGHEGLLAQRREAQPVDLQAPDAADRAQRAVVGLQPQLLAAAAEGGADRAVAFDLLVPVAGAGRAEAQAVERPRQAAGLAAQAEAVALHADRHVGLDRHAVVVAVSVHGQPQVCVGRGQPAAHRAAFGARGRIAHARRRRQRLAAFDRHEARHAQVRAAAAEGIGVPGPGAPAGVEHGRGTALGGGTTQAPLGARADALLRGTRNAVVQAVDHAAGGVAAVQQRRRAAQQLDALGHQRVLRHRVVEAEVGRVDAARAVVQHAHAVAVQPADHRAAAVGPEAAAGGARQAVQRVAQRGGAAQHQRVARQAAGRLRQGVARQRVAGDDDGGGLGVQRQLQAAGQQGGPGSQ